MYGKNMIFHIYIIIHGPYRQAYKIIVHFLISYSTLTWQTGLMVSLAQ